MTCPHGMPKPTTCIECMDDGPVTEPPAWARVGPFVAKYDAECPACDRSIRADRTLIYRWDRGDETVYTHRDCQPIGRVQR